MAIVVNKGNVYEPMDHHWHGDADHVHGSGGDGVPSDFPTTGIDPVVLGTRLYGQDAADAIGYLTVEDALYAPFGGSTGDMIPLGSAGLYHVKRGTQAIPITTSEPTIRIDKYENISTATQPNPVDNAHNASIVLISEASAASQVQTCGIWCEQRGGGASFGADCGGIGSIGWVIHDVPRGGGGAYLEGKKTFTQNFVLGAELRATNGSGVADAYVPNQFSKSMGAWATPDGPAGINCAAAYVAGTLNTNKWDVGFACIAGSVVSAAFRDDSSAVASILINGTHLEGINLAGATITGSVAIGLPHNKYIQGVNAAGNAFIPCIGIDTADRVLIGGPTSTTYIPGSLFASTINAYQSAPGTQGKLIFYGGGPAWEFVKHSDESFYLYSYVATTPSPVLIHCGAGTTATIGFFGHTPVVQQTLGAALSTGGAETNTNLATRINQLRTAMINLGLAV